MRVCRDVRVVPAAVQHDALRVLLLQRRLQLRQSQRKVVLAVADGRVAKVASVQCREHVVHQPLHRLGRSGKRDRRSQTRRADVSAWLAWTLDRLHVRHGQSVS